MPYHVIFVKLLSSLFIVIYVKCTTCVEHKYELFKMQGSTVLCPNSSTNSCELHCAHVAFLLVNMNITKIDIWKKMEKKQKTTHTIFYKNWILPKYETIAIRSTDQKANLEKNSRKLKSDVDKHGNQWNKAIDTIIHKYK